MSVVSNTLLLTGDDGYQISRSVRLRSSASAYLNRTLGSGNQQKWTWSAWVKRGKLATYQYLFQSYSSSSNRAGFILNGSDQFVYSGSVASLTSTAVFRDPSAWYHIVVAFDATQATAANRVILYVNGVSQTLSGTAPTQNTNDYINGAFTHYIGTGNESVATFYYEDGYNTEVNFIDGQSLTPSSFGETDAVTGVWKPKKYAGTYGTNGFYLNFKDPSSTTTIGYDYSGNGNNWTSNNISVTSGVTYDSMIDVPTMGTTSSNHAVLNPLRMNGTVALSGSLAQGNLYFKSSTQYKTAISTVGMSTGKWYFEAQMANAGGVSDDNCVGIEIEGNPAANHFIGYDPNGVTTGYGYDSKFGNLYGGTAGGNDQTGGATWTTGDIIGVTYDADAGQAKWYKNNTLIYTKSGLSGTWFFAVSGYDSSQSNSYVYANFGQRPFAYTPPTGFKALNTQNLPDATIKKGNAYFDATLYTGNGTSQSIVNSGGFQPDLVWAKQRNGAANHRQIDSVRGASQVLFSSLTNAEVTDAAGLTSFNSNGFSVGTNQINDNAATMVAWQWKESVSAGFDIVTYTGDGTSSRNISHSLGVVPSMVIVKCRSSAYIWPVKHKSLASNNNVFLEQTTATTNVVSGTGSGGLGDLSSSTTFSVVAGTTNSNNTNQSAQTYVAYLFSEVAGYSKFGSYTGNGSADGPFVFTNFQPRWVMVKRTDSTSDWYIWDTSRDTYNVESATLLADTSGAETSATSIDGLSNGFKCRSATVVNASGGTYIYAAFASSPFKLSLAR